MIDQEKTHIWPGQKNSTENGGALPVEKSAEFDMMETEKKHNDDFIPVGGDVFDGSLPTDTNADNHFSSSVSLKDSSASEEATVLMGNSSEASAAEEEGTVFYGNSDNPPFTEQYDQSESGMAFFSVGSVIKNRFQILEALGEGGMGMVFKAADIRKLEARSRNPNVAIKVLNPGLARNEVLVAALQRECEKAQALSHPNIITVYDFDRDGDHVFMSMEYLVGQPLTSLIRDAGQTGGMKLERAWPIIRKMGEALAYAHKKHIVHSDFKPANVFVTDADEVKVLDFGIAAKLDHADETDMTVFDARMEGGHTPPYASFEMMNGGKADPRDDIYAFGLVVYEMLTGKHPYDRKPASKVFFDQQREGHSPQLTPIRGLSRKQWRLLKSAIELLQAQRPKNLDEWLLEFAPKKDYTLFKIAGSLSVVAGLGALMVFGGFFHSNEFAPTFKEPIPEISAAIKPPLANAGSNMQGKIGVPVVLNGVASKAEDGGLLTYKWRMIAKPEGSNSILKDEATVTPQFIPDRPGTYTAELVVTDTGNRISAPALTTVDVAPVVAQLPASQLLQQASSVDGVLYMAAGKAKYRIGEDLTLSIRLAKSGYLRVAYVGANGEVSELLPNQFQPGKVKADIEYRIPPKPDTFKLQVTGPIGVDKVIAVFSEAPLPKVENIVNSDGTLVSEMLKPEISSVMVGYDVLKKAS